MAWPGGPESVGLPRISPGWAQAPMATDGGFRLGGLDGGIYWVATPGAGQSVRAWATGTAPPASNTAWSWFTMW
ncbi:MAG: hypothetical protein Ct9H300mP1_06600 [Planctomycetaceae bacterium]|nr:MAG: hypothetical protein Ct9H300mP1_06600 [Planctomycetaceae bacterium]